MNVMTGTARVIAALKRHAGAVRPVLPFDLAHGRPAVFDFTAGGREMARVDLNDAAGFTERLFERIAAAELPVGVGRYAEDRALYRHSPLFDGTAERRSIHLGIDLFVVDGTPVTAPLDGVVHSFADNAGLGDYGPTEILEHCLEGVVFWTLYGHLSRDSLDGLAVGDKFAAGEEIGRLGDLHENGGWPPHLHFQLIADIGEYRGDFPGVAAPSQRTMWLERCPDPNLILRIPLLSD